MASWTWKKTWLVETPFHGESGQDEKGTSPPGTFKTGRCSITRIGFLCKHGITWVCLKMGVYHGIPAKWHCSRETASRQTHVFNCTNYFVQVGYRWEWLNFFTYPLVIKRGMLEKYIICRPSSMIFPSLATWETLDSGLNLAVRVIISVSNLSNHWCFGGSWETDSS